MTEAEAAATEWAGNVVRRVAGLATSGMLLLCWPLWVGPGDLPRVPFLSAIPQTTGAAAWALFVALLTAVVGAALGGRFWRAWFGLSLGLMAFLIGQDQHRFQPWAYQYAMTVLFLAAFPAGEGLKYARWWFVALYLHSGLSKLDASFVGELGPVFLRAASSPFGVDPSRWPARWQVAGSLAMPGGEVAVAGALAVRGLRRVGRPLAVALHAVLLAILGPWGLDHSAIVLAWNVATAAEVWAAFGPGLAGVGAPERRAWYAWPVLGVFWAGVTLPLGERWGVFDAWPSHALYASHVGRVVVLVHESSLSRSPAVARGHLADDGEGLWLRLDLNAWSRTARGTPVNPQDRACLGLAEALAARYGGPLPVRVVALGPADRWTGYRRREEAVGLDEVRRMGDRFRCNAHPWMGNRGER